MPAVKSTVLKPFLTLLALIVLTFIAPASTSQGEHPALSSLPAQLIWAWERPEDLRWLPKDVGVAYVAVAIELAGNSARIYPRANALYVRPETTMVPVVHVDASWRDPPTLDDAQVATIVDHVLQATRRNNSQVVQLDFEVRRSQRPFLAAVIKSIRARLPRDKALSMTALASWCAGDYWLAHLPADEIVPMAFRMARDDKQIRNFLAQHGRFQRERCKDAIGTSTDEPVLGIQAARRYFFSPVPWTQTAWQQLNERKVF